LTRTDEVAWRDKLTSYPDDLIALDDYVYREGLAVRLDINRKRLQRKINSLDLPDHKLPKVSAELAALYGKTFEPPFAAGRADRIHLIGTRTPLGEFCTEALRQALCAKAKAAGAPKPESLVTAHYPPYLGSAKQPQFAGLGLPRFLDRCQQIISQARDDRYEVILAPNGGYKTLIAYLTLLGLMEDLPIRYVYEDAEEVLTLPALPLGLDVVRWRREKSRLELIEGEPTDSRVIFDRLSYPGLVEKRQEAGGERFRLSPLARYLEVKYLEVASRSELSRFTSNTTLRANLRNAEGVDFIGMFERLSALADLIWYGDRIDRIVDHGALHHYDLFDIAERILLPLFWWHSDVRGAPEPFLLPEELFALLGAVYLHDCGNVVGSLSVGDTIRSLSDDEIRDHHHVLGYLRLRPVAGRDKLAAREMQQPLHDWLLASKQSLGGTPWGSVGTEVWHGYLNAIATLGVYHRKDAPLDCKKPTEPYRFLTYPVDGLTGDDGVLLPLMRLGSRNCGSVEIPADRMRLLACLLRMIDSLDQQVGRTGPRQRVDFHLADLRRQAATLDHWLKQTRAAFPADIQPELAGWDGLSQPGIASACLALQARLGGQPPAAALAGEYAVRLRDGRFQGGQDKHFAPKQAVRAVRIRPCLEPGSILFEIKLDFDDDVPLDTRVSAEMGILEDVEKEYVNPEVRLTLEGRGIFFICKRTVR
jgi:CRISPR/Cas system-associated protein Csm6